jgi:polyisoprenoid-binding protein YceI
MTTTQAQNLPAVGSWVLDPTHTDITFTARHLVVAKVKGSFERFSGEVVVADDISASSVDVRIEAASISTGTDDRDAHLRSGDFLDADNHPELRFVSTSVRENGTDWAVDGELTIRGVSNPVTLDVEYLGTATDPFGNTKAAFSASTEIDRTEWGLTWNAPLEAGGVLVGEKVKIEIDAQASPIG